MYRVKITYPMEMIGNAQNFAYLDKIITDTRGKFGKMKNHGTECVVSVDFDESGFLDQFFERTEKLFATCTDEKMPPPLLAESPRKSCVGATFRIELKRVEEGKIGSRMDDYGAGDQDPDS